MHTKLYLQPTHMNTFILLKDFEYEGVTVPKGFETNGADIPQVFWSCGSPPFEPKFLPAVILHDYLINIGNIEHANNVYKRVMFEIENSIKTNIMVKAVRCYWWFINRIR